MPRINFRQFTILWEKVKNRFKEGNPKTVFDLENLNIDLKSKSLELSLNNLQKIKDKFLGYIDNEVHPPDVNLPISVLEKLQKYSNVEKLNSLMDEAAKIPLAKIQFVGREAELDVLDNFFSSSEQKILSITGVPLIGKTSLVEYFFEKKVFNDNDILRVDLRPEPESPEITIKNYLFPKTTFGDLTDLSLNSNRIIIVIRNFEEALRLSGDFNDLHKINEKYSQIRNLLLKICDSSNIKLILESRFKVNFEAFLSGFTSAIRRLQLEGVEKEMFWNFYKFKLQRNEFDKLCKIFENHTGMLALIFNNEWLFDNNLINSIDNLNRTIKFKHPKTTKSLYLCIEYIFQKLENQEIWILSILSYLTDPINQKELKTGLQGILGEKDLNKIDQFLGSLERKLLINTKSQFYLLNPFIKKICFSLLQENHDDKLRKIAGNSYFKMKGYLPKYSKIKNAFDNNDFRFLFNHGKILLQDRDYDAALESFQLGEMIDPKKKFVWLELARVYKWKKEFDLAIDQLQKILKQNEKDVVAMNEKADCYLKKGDYDLAIIIAKDSISQGHYESYSILSKAYEEKNDLIRALEISKNGLRKSGHWNKENLRRLYLRQTNKAKKELDDGNIKRKQIEQLLESNQKNMEDKIDLFGTGNVPPELIARNAELKIRLEFIKNKITKIQELI